MNSPQQLKLPIEPAAAKADDSTPAAYHVLYTVGHSNMTADEFIDLLKQHDVAVLLDVRSAPHSKYVPHFNKADLEGTLKDAQIDYRYAGEFLGGQPKDPSVYEKGQLPDEQTGRADFLRVVKYTTVMQRDWYLRGIERLIQLMLDAEKKGKNIAVMCSESDPFDCHRHHLIARSLADPNVKVIDGDIEVRHILKDGKAQIVNPAAFEDQVTQPRLF